ncbi:hypothetical protein [Fulvivirga sedimenti]|uniref:6-bladed beta-propeller n=1 Tax=Fulvivirga sedimenti TaxID=2879465 RepID=A0A9X1HMH0_9BACT|nr:hypothetical protein [Fulvivirga sedimenti]MCA6074156.1 hypothetical protein [Fulvivirga sedimenti]
MKNRIFVLLTVVPLLLLLFIFGMHQKTLETPKNSDHGTRNMKAYLKKKDTFVYPGSSVDGWQEFDGRLFILDQAAQQFFIINYHGQMLDTLGVKGEAPWEHQQVRRFSVGPRGVFTVDNSLMSVKQTDMDNEPVFYDKLNEPFWDGVFLKDQKFLLLNDESEAFGFYTWDSRLNERSATTRFDSLPGIDPSKNLNIAYEGEMVQGRDRHFYVCNRAGMYLVISSDGRIDHVGKTIDETPAPRIVERRMNNMVVFERQPDEYVNYSATTDDEHLYILSTVAFQETNNLSIDVYDSEEGYRYSMEVPNHHNNYPISILKGKNLFWVLYEDLYISSFEIIFPAS